MTKNMRCCIMDKKFIGGAILAAAFTVAAIVYLTGLDDKTALTPHRVLGWGDAGATCPANVCSASDASVVEEVWTEGADAAVATKHDVTACKEVHVPCPALRCQVATVLLQPHAAEAARVSDTEAPAKKALYGKWRACGDPEHGLPFEEWPEGMSAVGDVREVSWQAPWQKTDVWVASVTKAVKVEDVAPFECRCGPGCRDPAGKGAKAHLIRLASETTAPDAGECASVPCVMTQGEYPETIRAACCKDECEGRTCGTGLCGGNCGTCADGFECRSYACYSAPGAG